jgi:hypothetical protein
VIGFAELGKNLGGKYLFKINELQILHHKAATPQWIPA